MCLLATPRKFSTVYDVDPCDIIMLYLNFLDFQFVHSPKFISNLTYLLFIDYLIDVFILVLLSAVHAKSYLKYLVFHPALLFN